MRSILAIETSTRHGSVALWRGGEVWRELTFSSDRSHNSRLFAPLAELWAQGRPEVIVAGTGPGSYSGIRVAISAALGLSLAGDIPLIGWPSLTAFDAPGLERYHVVGDARRGSFFIAELADGRLAGEPELVSAEELARRIEGVRAWTFDDVPPAPEVVQATPSAAWLARRVAALSAEEFAAFAAVMPEPMYLRAPFITMPRASVAGASRPPR